MKIIAIEGLDKSGKATATRMLQEYLTNRGLYVVRSEFHRYDTPTGELIMKWLTGRYDVDQLTIELIMTADKQAQQKYFEELEAEGVDVLVLDRYTGSQQVYSYANGVSPMWTKILQMHMRQPDMELFIDVTPEESMARKGKHNNGENDRYERDFELLSKVRELFLKRKNIKINGMQPIEGVHTDIIDAITSLLK